jgi:ADP-ribosylglycohydrolase
MIDIINLGGDTDTNACIAGMLAGAHYGLSGIQHSWLYNIQDYEYLYKLCEALWDRVRENSEIAQHAE